MNNPFENIGDSKRASIEASNWERARTLVENHWKFVRLDLIVQPVLTKLSEAIGGTVGTLVVDETKLPEPLENYNDTDQIRMLSKEEPKWVLSNSIVHYPDYTDTCQAGERIISVTWGRNDSDGLFTVNYFRDDGHDRHADDPQFYFLGSWRKWVAVSHINTPDVSSEGLIDVIKRLYDEQKSDIDTHFVLK